MEKAVLSRRALIAGGATVAGVAALGAGGLAPADAATAVIKKVVMYRVGRYRYNATTHVTTVLSATKVTVTARFVGSNVYLKNSRAVWTQIPYVWSKTKNGLIYSHYLKLKLDAAAAVAAAQNSPTGGYKVIAPTTFASVSPFHSSSDWARHLLRRAGYGPTTADLADVKRLGYAAWIEQQLNPSTINDSACDALLTRLHDASLPAQSTPIWKVNSLIDNGTVNSWEQYQSVLTDLTIRALWSKRQLLTVMEDFWGNHFNVTIFKDGTAESRAHYAYTIRTRAFGKFSDLLLAITRHPAMLTYLNNRESTALHPNENQGRELLELHTLGVDAGYGEDGVVNAARILTGTGVDSDSGEYAYQPWNHWVGSVKVLGFTHANSTETGGEAVVTALTNYLAHHPATAKRLAHKLAVRFVSDTPSDALVTMLAGVYLKHDTAIAPVLRALFSSAEFAHSIGAKVARPYEHIVSTARLMEVQPMLQNLDAPQQVWYLADNAGHNPFGQPFPTGWADTADEWESTAVTLARWNNAINIVSNWWPNQWNRPALYDLAVGASLPATHGALVDQVSTRLLGRTLADADKNAVLTFLGVTAATPLKSGSGAVNWQLNDWVSVLMDSPYQMMR
jgi:uncharacterized protein (DUF1800 family)